MIREQAGGELLVGQALLVETGHPHIRWCISAPTMRVPTLLDTPLPAYLLHGLRCVAHWMPVWKAYYPRHGDRDGRSRSPGGRRGHALGYPDALYPPAFPASLADVLSF